MKSLKEKQHRQPSRSTERNRQQLTIHNDREHHLDPRKGGSKTATSRAQSKPGTPEASSTATGEQRKLFQPTGGLPQPQPPPPDHSRAHQATA
ncbi:hypothetical protein D5086_015067 [Populus alba]|uniref:Uncharacterized protein n=1 Tax=Populus alba TaxID=43335 RepID=A0ACC4BZZ7_POPAL